METIEGRKKEGASQMRSSGNEQIRVVVIDRYVVKTMEAAGVCQLLRAYTKIRFGSETCSKH